MNNFKHTYILINENVKTLGIYYDEVSLINNLNKYVVETVETLKSYNVDMKKFYNNIAKWKISYFTNYEMGYYKFINNVLTSSNNNIPSIQYKINTLDFTNNNFDYEINKIFIADTDNVNCNIKLDNFDIKNLNNSDGTETLIKNCLLTENNNVLNPKQCVNKSNADILKEKLFKLEEEKRQRIQREQQELINKEKKKKMEIERALKINKDNEENYIRKYLVDRKLYFVFKNEILKKIRNENDIPLMYKKQWTIFKEMETKNILDTVIEAIDEYSNDLNNNNELSKMIQKEICQYKILDDTYKHLDINYNTNELFTSKTNTNGKFWRMINENENLSNDETSDESSDETDNETNDDSDDDSINEFTGPLLQKLNDNSVKINFSV